MLDKDLKVVAAQFASRVRLAVDERPFGSQHLHGVTVVVWVAPSEAPGDRAVAAEDAVGVRALLTYGDVRAQRLSRCPDGVCQAGVGGPVTHWKCFKDRVER